MKRVLALLVLLCLGCSGRGEMSGVVCFRLERGLWDRAPEPTLQGMPATSLILRTEGPPSGVSTIPPSAALALIGADSGAWWNPTIDSLVVVATDFAIYLHNDNNRRRQGVVRTLDSVVSTAPVSASRVSCRAGV